MRAVLKVEVLAVCFWGMVSSGMAGTSVRVQVLSVSGSPPQGGVGTSVVKLDCETNAIGPVEERTFTLSISENLPQGVGDELRSSLWMAASVVGNTLGNPLSDCTFTVKVNGMVDGPSASALHAVAMLALMRGDTIASNATMTGAILPDGTIGAVGGVNLKLRAAKKTGLSTVLVPACLRFEMGEKGKLVDLAALGKELDLKVKFVASIEEAYGILTGRPLTAPAQPAAVARVQLPPDLETALSKLAVEKHRDAVNALDRLDSKRIAGADPEVQEAIMSTIQEYQNDGIRALSLLQEGNLVAGCEKQWGSWVTAEAMAQWQAHGWRLADPGELAGKLGDAISNAFSLKLKKLESEPITPADKGILAVRCIDEALKALAVVSIVSLMDTKIGVEETEAAKQETTWLDLLLGVDPVAQTATVRKSFQARMGLASEWADIGNRCSVKDDYVYRATIEMAQKKVAAAPTKQLNPDRVRKWSLFGRARYQATSAMLSKTLARAAEQKDDPERFKLLLDPDIHRAIALDQLAAIAAESQQGGQADTVVAETLDKEFISAALMAKQETEIAAAIVKMELGAVDYDDDMTPDAFLMGGALRGMLDRAADQARQAIAAAQAVGYEVLGPRFDFLAAEGLRYGPPDEQLDALRRYWSAYVLCRLVSVCVR